MAITVVFDMDGCTSDQYDAVMKGLEAAGEESPDGRLFHVAAPREDGWLVVDVWESEQKLGPFAQTLMPLLDEVGLGGMQPRVLPVHNLVQ